MRAAITARVLAAVISFVAFSAAASATEWRVVKVTGDLWMESAGVQRVALTSPSGTVPDGATLVTGNNARVLLSRGAETIVIGPNSVVAMPKQAGGFTVIEQRAGETEFDVEKQNVQHFAVETPFLAAVVKGTHFVVRVGAADANVSVDRGLVEVDSHITGQTADVAPGQGVAVEGNTGRMSALSGNVEIRQGMPRIPGVKPLSSGDLYAMQAPAQPAAQKSFDVADASAAVVASRIVGGGQGPTGGTPAVGSLGGTNASTPAAGPADGASASVASTNNTGAGAVVSAAAGVAADIFQSNRRASRTNEPDMGMLTTMIIASFAAMALLGIGFAYVRTRF